jgi:sugar-specific transcriptional regulator TrmB
MKKAKEASAIPMTFRQARVYAYMVRYQQRYGEPATFRAIGRYMRFKSPLSSVHTHLELMVRKGAVMTIQQGKKRRYVAIPAPITGASPCVHDMIARSKDRTGA